MSGKKRLDVLLVERGLQESRQRAQAIIMSGLVFVNGQRLDKAGAPVAEDAAIEIRGSTLRYVSRGGLKLEKAMGTFPITLAGKTAADIGASTGGFTDCLLQAGAVSVACVDVNYGQLAWKLRSDPRVVCLERTNARYLTREQVPDTLDFASVDVSFISLKLILPPLAALLRRPQVHYDELAPFDPGRPDLPPDVKEQVEISVKYEGYIRRQEKQVEDFRKMASHALPPELDYASIQGLRLEAREKLAAVRPLDLGQASRISGVSPADVAALMIFLEK